MTQVTVALKRSIP